MKSKVSIEIEKREGRYSAYSPEIGSSVCVMQWTGVIRDVTLI